MNTDRWTLQIDEITEKFNKSFGSLTIGQLNLRPDVRSWSIAQNMEHLIRTNESYFPMLESLRKGIYKLPLVARMDWLVKWLGKTILKTVQPDRRKKVRTFSIWEPSQSAIPLDIVEKFVKHQEELKQMITSSSDLLDRGAIVSSPANRKIVYTLEVAFDIIVAHELRHYGQAKEVLQTLIKQ